MISFITSAKNKNNYPYTNKEVVFVGRSNVGKSSLINSLYGKIAYVGKTPGKTKLLNFFNINDMMYFVDFPGYGYAKVSKDMKKSFNKILIFILFKSIEQKEFGTSFGNTNNKWKQRNR